MTKKPIEISALSVQGSVTITASPDQVWQSLTGEVSAWWGAPYVCCDDTTDIRLDLRIGGPLYETGADGTEVLWGVISGYTPGSFIEFSGCCGMAPPVHGTWSFMLEEQDGGTRVTYNHYVMGLVSDAQMENYDKGWQDLIGARLKAFVERSERMGLGHEPNWARS
jgi:uncharacterized protein YndB with AHSA1/START domain